MMNREMMRVSEINGRRLAKKGWNDFKDVTREAIERHMSFNGARRESRLPDQVFQNNLFVVQVFNVMCAWGPVKKLMIRRGDALPNHNWNHLQRIKNEIFGEDAVALEVYPKQKNLTDVANLYWLWILPDGFDCPIEMRGRE